jgi:hypothetical protein
VLQLSPALSIEIRRLIKLSPALSNKDRDVTVVTSPVK